MAHLRYVTLTGVDEKTDIQDLVRLSEQYPFVEWGVLYSESRAGVEGRYPSLAWIEQFAVQAQRLNLNVALHLCGAVVPRLLTAFKGPHPLANPEVQRILELAQSFGRVQLNTVAKLEDKEVLRTLIRYISRCEQRTRVILQWHDKHAAICEQLQAEDAFEVLVDSSGGRGVARTDWPDLSAVHRRPGFAGGLGPDNLAEQLPRIAAVAEGLAFSVDMESKLRTADDRFDVSVCARVLAIAEEFDRKSRFAAGALHGNALQPVYELEGLWLDWWVGYLLGYDMIVPPLNASRAVYLYRPTGRFESFSPSDSEYLAVNAIHEERIALTPLEPTHTSDGSEDEADEPDLWFARAMGTTGTTYPGMKGKTLVQAGLRAIVAKHLGLALSTNPMADPPL